MLPDADKRYAIETCRSSESVLKKWFKNKWHTISAFVGCVIISESPLASLHEKQRTEIQDMLPQQYYNEKIHIFNKWF